MSKIFVGVIKNNLYNVKTMVKADSPEEAMAKVLEKFKDDLGIYFVKSDVEVYLFTV